jgi:hypothetical protein
MAGINYGRVVIGGLAAGVVANAFDFVTNMYLMAGDIERMARRLNLDMNLINSPSVGMRWVAVDFVLGLLIVWTYAAMRPRFGAGPATAVKAALVLLVAITAVLFGFSGMGIFTPDTLMKGALFSAIAMIAAGLAGAAVYKE